MVNSDVGMQGWVQGQRQTAGALLFSHSISSLFQAVHIPLTSLYLLLGGKDAWFGVCIKEIFSGSQEPVLTG